jgi:hypothetical protein
MSIFEKLKSIAKILLEAGKIEQYEQILEIQDRLDKIQKKLQKCEEENKTLKEKLEFKNNLFFENNAYWLKREDGSKEGPFCSRCWDRNKNQIRMLVNPTRGFCSCPECNNLIRY